MLELYGTVFKEEHVKTVENHIIPDTFVLENLEPYPGYHGKDMPTDQRPDTFFLVVTEEHSKEFIFRISDNIRKSTGYQFSGSPARIKIKNEDFHAIRIRDLNQYDRLEIIQKHFIASGLRFMKKRNVDETAFIELTKIFQLEWVNDFILKDISGIVHYIRLNGQVSWNRFLEATCFVKANLTENNFDAALVIIYASEVYDLVRIYDKKVTVDHLTQIRQKYLEGMRRLNP